MNPTRTDSSGRAAVLGATRTARRVVAAAFAATALLVGALVTERLLFEHASEQAVSNIRQAATLAGAILLDDERLTMAATLAAATGQERWMQRYDRFIPSIYQAIAEATALAPPEAAQRFDRATHRASVALEAMERQAFEAIRDGRHADAWALIEGPAYAAQKTTLLQGTQAFMDELQAGVRAQREQLIERSWWLAGALMLGWLLGVCLLWRHLVRRLRGAEEAFAEQQETVNRLALYDVLTGLPNRAHLQLQLAERLAVASRNDTRVALMLFDLDGFKPINDRHGHAAGDQVLRAIGQRLLAQVRKGEVAARLGGDEFVIVIDADDGTEAPALVARRLLAAVAEPVLLAQGPAVVGASVGVVLFPDDGEHPGELMRKADLAMYRAKAEARGDLRFFQAAMDDELRDRETLEQELAAAVVSGHIVPYFQPLVDLASGRVVGFEVLARWPHARRGLVPPVQFVPVAERCGLIDAMTESLMRSALRAARDWGGEPTLALNITPQQLKSAALTQRLLAVLAETGFEPQRFEVEITEDALIGDIDTARRCILELKRHGIRVALDDFGTGYSSLSQLSELPFDKIKIDRSFVQSMHRRSESATIIGAIVGLGHSLNLPITAEGIESAADARLLTTMGCDIGQGFLYARPVPAADVPALLRRLRERAGVVQVGGDAGAG